MNNSLSPKAIKALRQRVGLTQEKAAALLGVSWITWHRWETGKSKPMAIYVRLLTERWPRSKADLEKIRERTGDRQGLLT